MLNFQLNTEQRIQLYQSEVSLFTRWANAASDENSRRHWLKKVEERLDRIESLKG